MSNGEPEADTRADTEADRAPGADEGSEAPTRAAPARPPVAARGRDEATASVDHAELLCRLQESLAALDPDETTDYAALAERHGLDQDEVERVAAALAAVRDALGEDLDGGHLDRAPGAAPERDRPPPPLPKDYEVLSELGAGGMGVVYRVRQRSLDRVVALKVLRPDDRAFTTALERFRVEAKSLAKLRHRHIVTIHEVGESDDGIVYYTMELVDGDPLNTLIRDGSVTPSRAVKLVRQVASAIAYAHAQGIIHRDLKPANILVDRDGDARVVDFGLARDTASADDTGAGLTATGQVIGTPAYMSPEQARGDRARVGEPTDVYALGAVLYECLTGRPPFSGLPLLELIRAVAEVDPVAPRAIDPLIPRDLEVICCKALAKDPARRYATAQAMLEDLERFESGRPIRARPPGVAERVGRFVVRHRRTAAALLMNLLLIPAIIYLARPFEPPATAIAEEASALLAAGEFRGAATQFERAWERTGRQPVREWRLPERFALEQDPRERDLLLLIWDGLVGARIRHMRALASDGALDAAVELGERTVDQAVEAFPDLSVRFEPDEGDDTGEGRAFTRGWPREIELLWTLAACQEEAGRDRDAEVTLRMIDWCIAQALVLDALEAGADRSPTSDAWSAPFAETTRALLELVARSLQDPDDPTRPWALERLRLLFQESGWPEEAWLGTGERAAPLVVDALALLPSDPTDPSHRSTVYTLRDVVERLAGTAHRAETERALAAAVREVDRPDEQRTVAFELLCIAADLPFFGPWSDHQRDGTDELDPATVAAGLALWDEVRSLPRVEAYRRKLTSALPRLEPLPESSTSFDASDVRFREEPTVGAWLAPRIGYTDRVDVPTFGATAAAAFDRARAADDPRRLLADALGLPADLPLGPEAIPEVLPFYLEGEDPQPAIAHHLLTLLVPDEHPVPLWRNGLRWFDVEEHDEWRPSRWTVALRNADLLPPPPPHHIRLAFFVRRDGEDDPELLWEAIRPIEPGAPVDLEHTPQLPPVTAPLTLILDPAVPRRPALGVGNPETDPDGYHQRDARWEIDLEARLYWAGRSNAATAPRGLQLIVNGHVRGANASHGASAARIAPGTVFTPYRWPEEVDHDDGTTGMPIVLVVVEPGAASEATPWALADWRGRLATDLGAVADGAADRHRATSLVDVATLLATPAMAPDLARIDAARAERRSDDLRFRQSWLAARLFAGDASALEETEAIDVLVGSRLFTAEVGHGELVRAILSTSNQALAGFLLDRLKTVPRPSKWGQRPLPAGVARRLARADAEGRLAVPLPEWLRGWIADAGEVQTARQPSMLWTVIPVAIAILLGLAVAVLAAAAFGRGTPEPRRGLAAAWLVSVGIVLASLRLYVGDRLLPTELLGLAGALAGAILLARGAAGTRTGALVGRVVPMALGIGLGLRVAWWLGAPGGVWTVASFATTIGVALLPLLARELCDPASRGKVERRLTLLVALGLAALALSPWIEDLDRFGPQQLLHVTMMIPPGTPPLEQLAAAVLVIDLIVLGAFVALVARAQSLAGAARSITRPRSIVRTSPSAASATGSAPPTVPSSSGRR